jgi:DNA-binding transcriptional ArsR family regulator
MSNHSAATAARADDVFDALGDPTRRQIIARLRPGPPASASWPTS